MPSWSAWPSPRCCCATTTNATGCGPPPPGSGTCFPACLAKAPTTGGSRTWRRCWRPRCGGWPTRPRVGGAAAAAGRHAGGLRPVHHHRQTLGPVRLRRLRLRGRPQPLLPGVKLLLVWTAEGTVTGFGQRRARSWDLPQLAAPARGGDHLDAEAPARPGRPRRPRARRPVGPRRAAPAGPQHRDLAQLADRRPNQALPARLRPLTSIFGAVIELRLGLARVCLRLRDRWLCGGLLALVGRRRWSRVSVAGR